MKKISTLFLASIFVSSLMYAQVCPSVAEFRASNQNKLFFVFTDEASADYWYDQDASGSGTTNQLTNVAVVGTHTVTAEVINFTLSGTAGNISCLNETGTPPLRVDCIGSKYTSTAGGNFEGTITLNSMVCLYVNGALPISLVDFASESNKNSVKLTWKTASEKNNDYMAIERSLDGKSFEKIGEVKGAGTTLEAQNYEFEDLRPIEGTSYYRLKQVDFDGSREYSDVIAVRFGSSDRDSKWNVYPTNITEAQSINIDLSTFSENASLDVQIIDMTGKMLYNQKQSGSQILEVATDLFETGIYIININDNGVISQKKFIKS